MSNAYHNGFTNNPQHGKPRDLAANEETVQKEDEQGNSLSNGRCFPDECSGIEESRPEEIAEILQGIGVVSSWSGLLPRPDDFTKYNQETQQKIIEWTDAQILGESERQDRITDAEIKRGHMSLATTFVFNIALLVAVFIAFVITENPSVFWAFTIPGASIVGNVVISIKRKDTHQD